MKVVGSDFNPAKNASHYSYWVAIGSGLTVYTDISGTVGSIVSCQSCVMHIISNLIVLLHKAYQRVGRLSM